MAVNTRVLVADYVKFRLDKDGLADQCDIQVSAVGNVQQTMRVLGEEFELRYNQVFQEMSQQLHITPNTTHPTFVAVVDELFRDREADNDAGQLRVRWGRIVALFAFAGCLSVQCVQKELPNQVENVIDWTATYIDQQLSSWIQQNNGWVCIKICVKLVMVVNRCTTAVSTLYI